MARCRRRWMIDRAKLRIRIHDQRVGGTAQQLQEGYTDKDGREHLGLEVLDERLTRDHEARQRRRAALREKKRGLGKPTPKQAAGKLAGSPHAGDAAPPDREPPGRGTPAASGSRGGDSAASKELIAAVQNQEGMMRDMVRMMGEARDALLEAVAVTTGATRRLEAAG
jgi:hypothetical protein